MKKRLIMLSFCVLTAMSYAQVGINTTDPNAQLDIRSSNQATPSNTDGVLIPKADEFPVVNPIAAQDGMLLFITGNGIAIRGFYFWNQMTANWNSIGNGANTLDLAYDQGGNGLGRIINATDGPMAIDGTADATAFPNTGLLEIGNTLRLDANEIITNTGQELFLQFTNDSDLSVDDTTLFVDGTNDRVGIGTFQPDYRFHVATGRAEITEANEATGTINSGVLEIANSLRMDGDEIITNTGTSLNLQNGNNGDLSIDGNTLYVDSSTNNVGIGTISPSDKLVITGGRVEITTQTEATGSGGTGSLEIGNGLRIDNNEITSSTTLYLQEDGLASLDISDGAVFVNGTSDFTGIGTVNPAKRLHVRHFNSSASGFGISNINGAGGLWHFHVRSNLGERLELHFNNAYRGNFDATSGFYTSVSDRNLKNNISSIKSVLKKVKELNVVDYEFINQKNKRKYVGLIAQEVKKIFPHLVYGTSEAITDNSNNYYTMDYSGFGILAIKAIQEQQEIIEAQNIKLKRLDRLEKELNDIKALLRRN
jgi:hypothetical protein